MKNPASEVLVQAGTDRKAGRKFREIMEETGLNHSQVELAAWDVMIPAEDRIDLEGYTEEEANYLVTVARATTEFSWGRLSVQASSKGAYTGKGGRRISEGSVRNRFEATTGLSSKGQRIGKGGRFLTYGGSGEPRYYQDKLNKPGITFRVEDGRPDPGTVDPTKKPTQLQRRVKALAAKFDVTQATD